MSSDDLETGTFTIMALESGIKYEDLDEAPNEPLLIEIVGFKPRDLGRISQKFDIDLEDLQDLLDLDERPRLQVEDKFTMIVLRVPVNLEAGDREFSTYPIGVFTNGRDLVILQHELMPLRRKRHWRRVRHATTAAETIYRLWDTVTMSFGHTLDIIEATINKTEDRIMSEIYPSQLEHFFQLSRDAIFIEAALKSNMKVLRRMMRIQRIGKMILDADRLEELEVDLQQELESSRIYRELIENAMNAYDTIVGHNLNKVIKTLTSISLLVSVPTLIASLYGMNMGLPFVDAPSDPLAFGLILLMSLLITTPLLILLRYKNLV
ncbi:MAG: CorA family divalent cation transporter [Candidatus Thorarchaeota archaeon]